MVFTRQQVREAFWAILARGLYQLWACDYFRPSWSMGDRVHTFRICDGGWSDDEEGDQDTDGVFDTDFMDVD